MFQKLQGAERKTRDEERRAAKRKMTATGRKKLDELYHPTQDRSEFYTMQDLAKPPVLFSPADDIEKVLNLFNICHIKYLLTITFSFRVFMDTRLIHFLELQKDLKAPLRFFCMGKNPELLH